MVEFCHSIDRSEGALSKGGLCSIGIIPARFASTRFPGKPLVMIAGKSLLQRTYENARRCPLLDRLVVATDDERIMRHVEEFGGEVVFTSPECATGTDRLAEAYFGDPSLASDIVVNIQGDEPCLAPSTIERVIAQLIEDPAAEMATAAVRLNCEMQATSPHVVKCTFDRHGKALYFSRALIPSNKSGKFSPSSTYYKHLGIYAYRATFLRQLAEWPRTELQSEEDLEQLKVLEHGARIKVAIAEWDSHGVDTPEDIHTIEKLLCP